MVEDLAAEHDTLLQFLYLCPVGVIEIDTTGKVSRMNALGAQLLLPLAGASGLGNLVTVLARYSPGLGSLIRDFPGDHGTICQDVPIELRRVAAAGRGPWVLSLTILKIRPAVLMALLSDISNLMAKEQSIRASERRFSALFESVRDCALFSLDADYKIDSWNRSGERLLGYRAEEALGRSTNFLYAAEEHSPSTGGGLPVARQSEGSSRKGWYQHQNGARFWGEEILSVLRDDEGSMIGHSVVVHDITESRDTEESLRAQLATDHLTGLRNGRYFTELLAGEIERFRRYGSVLSVILISVDFFRQLNEAHGSRGGDCVLQAIAHLCRANLRTVDTVARLGFEEFALLLPATDAPGALIVAERLRRTAGATVVSQGVSQISFSLSLGVATAHKNTWDACELLGDADRSLREAKAAGCNRTVAHPYPA